MATVICHGKPRFANQSDCASRYFRGIYFIAQSWTNNTDRWSRLSSTECFASAWWTEQRWWAFQLKISSFAWRKTWSISALSSSESCSLEHFRSSVLKRVCNWEHCGQESLCTWFQVRRYSSLVGSLRAWIRQWSATNEASTECTCYKQSTHNRQFVSARRAHCLLTQS